MAPQILIVDDSATMRHVIARMLVHQGYEVSQASSGDAALHIASRVQFDLLLTDIHMPGMDGIALIEALREVDGYRTIPVLVLTADVSEEVKARGSDAGAAGWFHKPPDEDQLMLAIEELLDDA